MSFYTMLSQYYDELFPLNEKCFTFMKEHFPAGTAVLDAGCGSGLLVNRLRREGVDARGFDLDESMVELARKGLGVDGAGEKEPKGVQDIFRCGDLAAMAELYKGELFDGIFCLGNTLVHIPFNQQLRFLGQAVSLLKPGGILVLQILNYTNIIEENMPFPALETEHCRFIREYKESEEKGRLFFHTALEDRASGEVFRNSVTHYPLMPEALMAMMSMNAFAGWETQGGWDGRAVSSDTLPLIVLAGTEA